MIKKNFVYYPLLLAIYPILALFSHNLEELSISIIVWPVVVSILITIFLWSGLAYFLKNNLKAALIVALLIIVFFSYGHLYNLMPRVTFLARGILIGPKKILLGISGLVIFSLIFLILRTRKNLIDSSRILNIVAGFLVLISLLNIGFYKIKHLPAAAGFKKQLEIQGPARSGNFPDIYYIIPDTYANEQALKNDFHFDNSDFINFLKSKDFFVPSKSHSNYSLTFLSLASSLNLQYLGYLEEQIGTNSCDRTVPYQMIQTSEVVKFLKSKGYRFINFSSGWGATDHIKEADLEFNYGFGNEFIFALLRTTFLRLFEDYSAGNFYRNKILFTLSNLEKVPQIKGPKFVLVHLLIPHKPYVFGKNGEPVSGVPITLTGHDLTKKKNRRYINQLIFTNKKMRRIIQVLLEKSEKPPIIILQSDHGPLGGEHYKRMEIFSAFYLSQGGSKVFYNSITPVNIFRLIFNYYFGTKMEILSDRRYFSTYDYPYRFEFINK